MQGRCDARRSNRGSFPMPMTAQAEGVTLREAGTGMWLLGNLAAFCGAMDDIADA